MILKKEIEKIVLQENVFRSTVGKDWVLGQFIDTMLMPCGCGRWLHYTTRYRAGFHSAASLAAAHAGMKLSIAHNIPTFRLIKLRGESVRYF